MSRNARHLLLLISLVMVTAAQADPSNPPEHGVGSVVFTPAARPQLPNLAPRPNDAPDARDSRRYGIGYDARHGMDADGMQSRNSRIESESVAPLQSSSSGNGAGAARGGRGR